tara:strand:+ start:58 stop:393 length:336 start_codon:yes stop_codon:yes gene_type:complete
MRINIDYLDTEEKEKARSVESTDKKPKPYMKGLISLHTDRIVTSEDGDRHKSITKSIKPSVSSFNQTKNLFLNKNKPQIRIVEQENFSRNPSGLNLNNTYYPNPTNYSATL